MNDIQDDAPKTVSKPSASLNLAQMRRDEEERFQRIKEKYGDYHPGPCPNCGRYRLMEGKDGKRRCEKCHWCIEDNDYDLEMW